MGQEVFSVRELTTRKEVCAERMDETLKGCGAQLSLHHQRPERGTISNSEEVWSQNLKESHSLMSKKVK